MSETQEEFNLRKQRFKESCFIDNPPVLTEKDTYFGKQYENEPCSYIWEETDDTLAIKLNRKCRNRAWKNIFEKEDYTTYIQGNGAEGHQPVVEITKKV